MNNRLYKLMNWPKIEGIVYSEEDQPHDVLGPHVAGNGTLLQTFQPGAKGVEVVIKGEKETYKMEMADEEGFFACLIPGKNIGKYVYRVTDGDKNVREVKDAYAFQPQITEKDLDKFEAGIHYTVYDKLGAHPLTVSGVKGVNFAVWAPNVIRASVVGDFNKWDGRVHQMRRLGDSGIFEIFIPDVKVGDTYKFELKVKGGLTYMKADPYAFGQQLRPDSASIVRDIKQFQWEDSDWLDIRKARQSCEAPISVYELYLGSFRRPEGGEEYYNYRELAPMILQYVKEMGYTHIELMPVMEHPLDKSWGYQVIGYYAPTSRYGTAEDFMFFMNEMHKAGIGVILDWVPAHFPRDTYGLSNFDGTCLYEHLDPRKGFHPHWGTLIYNYGRPQVSNYLIANALYWVEKYHVDGIRIDAVASMLYLDYGKSDGEWVANMYGGNENLEAIEFLKHLNSMMKKRNPGVMMIAEESTSWPQVTGDLDDGGLGFDMKWNMGWMNDYLRYINFDPYFRAHHHHELTFSMIYAYSENFMLVFSHDEVVHGKSTMIGKMPGEVADKFSDLRLTYAYMMMHPGKKLLFMGQDIAEFKEFDETREVEWSLLQYPEHQQLNHLVRTLNRFYRKNPALYTLDTNPDGFQWINCITAEKCMLSFIRQSKKEEEMLVVVANFANMMQDFVIGVPVEGKYKEILNTDAKEFGGQGRVNSRAKMTEEKEIDECPFSFKMTSAPLSLSVFGYTPFSDEERAEILRKKEEMIRKKLQKEKEAAEKKAAAEKTAAEKRAKAEKEAAERKAAKELERLKKKDKAK